MKEFILCAAIYYNDGIVYMHQPKNISTGYVMCGRRHHNIINLRAQITGRKTVANDVQGFITSLDRFVNRKEAMNIAYAAKQIPSDKWGEEKELYSEDLY